MSRLTSASSWLGRMRRVAARPPLNSPSRFPLLLLLAFGCCDLGRAVGAYVAVSNAARVGAEYGATHGYTSYTYASWESQVTQQAQQEMQGTPAFNPNHCRSPSPPSRQPRAICTW